MACHIETEVTTYHSVRCHGRSSSIAPHEASLVIWLMLMTVHMVAYVWCLPLAAPALHLAVP